MSIVVISLLLCISQALLFVSCFASTPLTKKATSVFNNVENLSHYMANYYKHPEPDKLPDFINKFFKINPKGENIVMAFLTRIVKDNPGKIGEWTKRFDLKDSVRRRLIYQAIWDANTETSRRYLLNLTSSKDVIISKITTEITSVPPNEVLFRKVTDEVLDELWITYAASGDEQCLIRILKFVNQDPKNYMIKQDGKDLISLQGAYVAAGIWSLEKQRKQDPEIDHKIKKIVIQYPHLDYQKKIRKEKNRESHLICVNSR